MTSIRSCHTLSRNLAIPLRPYRPATVENVYEKLAETPNMYSLCLKPLLWRGYRRVPIGGYPMIYKVMMKRDLYIERFFSHLEDYENLFVSSTGQRASQR